MTTEAWFRNPQFYIKELVECGGPFRVVWDRGILVKKNIDPHRHAELYFAGTDDWRILCVGEQGTAELDPEHSLKNPAAVYPTWKYGEKFEILEEMIAYPLGEDMEACTADIPVDQRPVPNQEHRVVLIDLPPVNLNANRPFYRNLKELQEEYPNCIMHIHGSYSFRVMFGMGFGSADVEPRADAANGRVQMPNGKSVAWAQSVGNPQWINLFGMKVTDLKVPRNRCMYNIKSARWAAENWDENINFKTRGSTVVDPDSPITVNPATVRRTSIPVTVKEGDKIACDSCSQSEVCKYYREGAVCSVPGTESSVLAKLFKSRDSSHIIDGLGAVLGKQAERLERAVGDEEEFGELDPEVTKMFNHVFGNGIKLAKLIDPALARPGVQINVGGAGIVAAANNKQFVAAVVRELEQQGVARADITPRMIEAQMQRMAGIEVVQGEATEQAS